MQHTENVTPRLERLIAFDRQFEGEVSDSTVAQAALDLTAEAALVKVQVVARSASPARAVGAGAAVGAALVRETAVAKRPRMVLIWTILAVKARKNDYTKLCGEKNAW